MILLAYYIIHKMPHIIPISTLRWFRSYEFIYTIKWREDQEIKRETRRTLRRESEQYYFCIDFGLLGFACIEILTHLFNNISLLLPYFHSRASPLLLFVSISYKFIVLDQGWIVLPIVLSGLRLIVYLVLIVRFPNRAFWNCHQSKSTFW